MTDLYWASVIITCFFTYIAVVADSWVPWVLVVLGLIWMFVEALKKVSK